MWNVGDRVMVVPFDPASDDLWVDEPPTVEEWDGKGAGSSQGTLKQYFVLASPLQHGRVTI